jgi:hypothetical protein
MAPRLFASSGVGTIAEKASLKVALRNLIKSEATRRWRSRFGSVVLAVHQSKLFLGQLFKTLSGWLWRSVIVVVVCG